MQQQHVYTAILENGMKFVGVGFTPQDAVTCMGDNFIRSALQFGEGQVFENPPIDSHRFVGEIGVFRRFNPSHVQAFFEENKNILVFDAIEIAEATIKGDDKFLENLHNPSVFWLKSGILH